MTGALESFLDLEEKSRKNYRNFSLDTSNYSNSAHCSFLCVCFSSSSLVVICLNHHGRIINARNKMQFLVTTSFKVRNCGQLWLVGGSQENVSTSKEFIAELEAYVFNLETVVKMIQYLVKSLVNFIL